MMDLDEAIQSLVDEMEKQAALGHSEHIDNLEQLAEWLKELKAYRETWRKLGMWLADTRLAIAPDEFLNDVDEELVRVAQVDMIDTVLEWMDKQEVQE
jgi:hypothetical protein